MITNYFTGASSDMQEATRIARAMVTQYGMSDKVNKLRHNVQNLGT